MERLVSAAVLVLALSSAAYANDSGPRPPPVDALLGGIVQERDVGLVFDYLREALRAAVDGREAPQPPAELTRRAEAIGEEVKRRGAAAAQAAIDAIEKSVRESMREPRRLPPTSPAQRI
jgi:hypothetical protein